MTNINPQLHWSTEGHDDYYRYCDVGESCSGAERAVIGSALVRNSVWKLQQHVLEAEGGIFLLQGNSTEKTLGTLPSMICTCYIYIYCIKLIY